MPPIKLTLESFEDVVGYPGKVFYVLHEYPGTGCPQVPYLAIDKTDDGGFKIRDLDPTPRKEFKDAQYKYDWPRDPRLQWACDEFEEVATPEIPPPVNAKAHSMPVIQEVKSIGLDFFQKNKYTQGLVVSKDGCRVEENGGNNFRPVVKLESSSRVLKETSAQDTSVTNSENASSSLSVIGTGGSGVRTEEFVSTNVGNESRQINTSVTQKACAENNSPQVVASVGEASGTGDTMVEFSKQTKSSDYQRASTSRNIVAAGNEGSAAFQKAEVTDKSKDSVPKHTDTVGQKSIDKSSSLFDESSVQDITVPHSLTNLSVSTLITQKSESAESNLKSDEKLVTSLCDSPCGSTLLKEPSVHEKSIPNSTLIQNTSASRTELIGKNLDHALKELSSPHNSSPVFGAPAEKTICVDSVDAKNGDAPNNSLASLPVPVDSSKSPKDVESAESECPGNSCIDDSPILSVAKTVHKSHSSSGKSTLALNNPCVKQKHPYDACSDVRIKNTVHEASIDLNSSVAESHREVVTPHTVIKEISGIVSQILAEHLKSSNHSNIAPTVEMSKSETKSEPQKIPQSDPCSLNDKLVVKDRTTEDTFHIEVEKELPSMVTDIISSCTKLSDSSEFRDESSKYRELKDQMDLDKNPVKKSRGAPLLPKVQKELSEVDWIVTKARNFVKQKRIALLKFEDQPAMKPSKGSSVSSRSKEVEAKNKSQKQRSEKILKKGFTSGSKPSCSGDTISKERDSAQGSRKRSSASSKHNSVGSSSGVELKDSARDSSSSGLARTLDVYEFPGDDGEPPCKPTNKISQRRNTVDGNESEPRVQTKRCSSKYLPYNLQKYRKELDKHRPTKKHANNLKAQKSVESSNSDEKTNAQSQSCPGSPVSSAEAHSVPVMQEVESNDLDCSQKNKRPVPVASNASQESNPVSINVKESGKNSITNSDGSLSSYAESTVSKTSKRNEISKMKERQTKMLQLLQKRNSTPELHVVGGKSESDASTKSGSPKVGKNSEKLQVVGMHKLPAMVSCRNQVKPVVKKAVKTNKSTSWLKVELSKGGDNSNECGDEHLEKEVHVRESQKTSMFESHVKSQSENLQNEGTNRLELSKAPLPEINRPKLALQKKLESSPSSSPLGKSEQSMISKAALPSEGEKAATASPKGTAKDKPPTILSTDDAPSDCPEYSDLSLATKLMKNDVKTCLDSPKRCLTDRKNEKTESVKVPKKVPVSHLKNEDENLVKKSSNVDLSSLGSPTVKIGSSEVTASREKPASSSRDDTSQSVANEDFSKKPPTAQLHSPKAKVAPIVTKEASLVELGPPVVTSPTVLTGDEFQTAVSPIATFASSVLTTISSTKVMTDSLDQLPTTESRKQLLRQLTSKLPEINTQSPFDDCTNEAVACSHADLIDDITNVVNSIVKVKTENEKMKKPSSLEPPTAEELGELYSEVFDDDNSRTERDETATKLLADESNLAAKLSAAPVSEVANAKVGQKLDDLPKGVNEDIEQETESYRTTTGIPIEHDVTTIIPTIVLDENMIQKTKLDENLQETPVNQSATTDQMASLEMNGNSEESAPCSRESTIATSLLTEDNGIGENQESQTSSDCFRGAPSDDDVVEISSQDSSPEIVDVDAVAPSTQTSEVTSSRRVKKRRRAFAFERVPSVVTLSRDRMVRGNKLAVLRKLVAQRFSVEPFSSKGAVPCTSGPKDRKQKTPCNAITSTLEEPTEAVELSRLLVRCENEDGKTKVVKAVVDNVVETAESELSKPTVHPFEPVVETAITGVAHLTADTAKPEDAEHVVAKPVVVNTSVAATELEITKSVVDAAKSGFINQHIHSVKPDITKLAAGAAKPEVTKASVNAAKSEVVCLLEDEGYPAEARSGEESIPFLDDEEYPPKSELPFNPLVMPRPIVALSSKRMDEDIAITGVTTVIGNSLLNVAGGGSGPSRPSSKRSIGDSSLPKRKRQCFIPAPVLLPIKTSSPANIRSGFSFSPRRGTVSYSRFKRLSSASSPTFEPVMPLPMLEFRDGPSREAGSPVSTAPPELTKQGNVPETSGTSSTKPLSSPAPNRSSTLTDELAPPILESVLPQPISEFQRSLPQPSLTPLTPSEQEKDSDKSETTSAEPSSSAQKRPSTLSGKLRARLGGIRPTTDEPALPSEISLATRRVSVVPTSSKVHNLSNPTRIRGKRKRSKKLQNEDGSHATYCDPYQDDIPSTSQNDHGGWKRELKVKKVVCRRGWYRYPPKSDQSSEDMEHNPSSEYKTSQEDRNVSAQGKKKAKRNSRRSCPEVGGRSTLPDLSLVHGDHVKGRECSPPTDLSPVRSIGKQGSSTSVEASESTSGQRDLQGHPDERSVLDPALKKKRGQEALNRDLAMIADGRTTQTTHHRQDPMNIIKGGREEAAWRNHKKDGHRFLGSRLKNFFQPAVTPPGSSGSFSGNWNNRRGSYALKPSQQAAEASSPSTKKLRSSTGLSRGESEGRHKGGGVQKDRPWKSNSRCQDGEVQRKSDDPCQDGGAQKDRSTTKKRSDGPGQRRRKARGGRSRPVLRSTAHKSRSGLIRQGDS